ncbi:MAG TPA: translation initiation factor IF-2 [Desulfuromonadales bacterium]|nr:translation initiation factor IF-2 [Desulfuromonadales bacterium]
MAKVRVYELAQKLGLENKELIERLKSKGVEVKSHMSVVEENDLKAFEETSTAGGDTDQTVERVEERRITNGIIRRRRKEVAQPPAETTPEEPVAEGVPAQAEVAEEPVEEVEAAVSKPAEETAGEQEAPAAAETTESRAEKAEAVPSESERAESAVKARPEPAEPATEEAPRTVEKEQQKPEKKPAGEAVEKPREEKPQKATANRAKILGRVELPKVKPKPEKTERRDQPRRQEGKPVKPVARKAPEAPAAPTISPGEAPIADKEGRNRRKKKAKNAEGVDREARGGRRTKRDRMEVFEPERGGRARRQKKGGKKDRQPKQEQSVITKAVKRIIRISDTITVGELAKRMGIKANELIKELMRQGQMVTINHPLDYESAALLASEFGYEVENVAFDEEVALEHTSLKGVEEKPEDLEPRPPVVTIMGHVDHGKTSLLDALRATDVTAGEAGGITQHIGAYDVQLADRQITFLDTPGHEAFTAMRSRGADVTDIVILVVAADDGVKPQTKEAINHSKAAGVPLIVAINKMDKPEANPERVKQELTEFELVPEDWGGETIFVEVSAKARMNLEQLLEMVLLQADVLELKANPNKRARGAIVEARLDRGRGPVATVLVQEGTLKIGDPIVAGVHSGRVRSMTDDRGQSVKEAGPSFPVEVTGLDGVPEAGDTFHAAEGEKVSKEVAQHRQQKLREAELAKTSKISLEQLYAKIQEGDVKELNVIIKGDVQGSVEALTESLTKLSTDACRLAVIHSGVGGIIESDVSLASASEAIIVGFNVRPEPKANTLADREGVDIRLYNVIYDAVDDVRNAMEGLLAPTLHEKPLGRVEVRDTFHVSRVGTIAGCYVLSGKVVRGAKVRLVRDNVVVWEGKMDSLKRFKDDAKEVAAGYECGIGLENYNNIKVGDIIEAFEIEEVRTVL